VARAAGPLIANKKDAGIRHVAFLRAINVGGHIVKMDQLRELFKKMKFANVETFIQSGNVIFDSAEKPEDIESRIEERLEKALGYPVGTFVRSPAQLQDIARCEPFNAAEQKAAANIMVGFLRGPLSANAHDALKSLCGPIHVFRGHGREVYWLRHKLGDFADVSGPRLEKATGPATYRSLTTVNKIIAKYCGDAPAATTERKRARE
jgi:uncharacterized protein (DUF1697 family)